MRRRLKNLLTIRARTLEAFIAVLRKYGCTEVTAYPGRYPKDVKRTSVVGLIGSFDFRVRYIAEAPNGRPVIFEQMNFTAFGTEYSFSDAADRAVKLIKNSSIAEDALKRIKKEIPDIKTAIVSADNNPKKGDHRIALYSV